ncbi:MAG TPA: shikimate kinase [Candidatus Limnocylindrales bacterium]|nr:shikimate kinase [Candidatus Limnocylindrales bacterium]
MTLDGACRVLLIGMMGSGKSTIGRLLSTAMGWPYVDNDELVRRSHGATARQILAERGEAEMRGAESDALARAVREPAPSIIGVAGGTIIEPENRELLRAGGVVVWFRADAAALESRAMGADHRPWLDSGGPRWIRETVRERDPLYASVADVAIDTGTEPAEDSAAELLEWLASVPACRPALSSGEPPARDP